MMIDKIRRSEEDKSIMLKTISPLKINIPLRNRREAQNNK